MCLGIRRSLSGAFDFAWERGGMSSGTKNDVDEIWKEIWSCVISYMMISMSVKFCY